MRVFFATRPADEGFARQLVRSLTSETNLEGIVMIGFVGFGGRARSKLYSPKKQRHNLTKLATAVL